MTTGWQYAVVVAIHAETPTAKTFRLQLPTAVRHVAGQHYVLRLTAPDGYQASRSYSVASAPDDGGAMDLTVELLPDGEVSSFLHEVVEVGDELEVRGPIGGWFVWPVDRPALFLGGGSGIVPLMSMLRAARAAERAPRTHLVASVRSPDHAYYRDELVGPDVTLLYTRQAPPGHDRRPGRLTADDLDGLLHPDQTVYVCGSAPFAGAASRLVAQMGHPVEQIRVERFGPTDGTSPSPP